MWSSGKCARSTKKKQSVMSSSSYIEEDTKLEEKYERPAWDKDFPRILPPPVRVAEKENKEVDVEPDMMQMNVSKFDDKNSPIGNGKTPRDVDVRPSEILDPAMQNPTQGSRPNSKEDVSKKSSVLNKESSKRKGTKEDSKENSARKEAKNLTSISDNKRERNRKGVDKEVASRSKNIQSVSHSAKSKENSQAKSNGKPKKQEETYKNIKLRAH